MRNNSVPKTHLVQIALYVQKTKYENCDWWTTFDAEREGVNWQFLYIYIYI